MKLYQVNKKQINELLLHTKKIDVNPIVHYRIPAKCRDFLLYLFMLGNLGNTVLIFDDFYNHYKKGWVIYQDHGNVTIKTSNGNIYFNPFYEYKTVTRMILFEKFIK